MELTPKPADNSAESIAKWRAENKDSLAKLGSDVSFAETSGHNLIPVDQMTPDELEALHEQKKDENNAN